MDHPVAQLGPGQIVKAVTRAVPDDNVFRIDRAELGNRLADVIVIERRHDVKSADHGEHLFNAGSGHRGTHRVDYAAMAAGGEHDEPASLHVVNGGELVIEVVRNVGAGVLFSRHVLRETAESVENSDDFHCGAQRLLERDLPDAAGRECMIGDDRRL